MKKFFTILVMLVVVCTAAYFGFNYFDNSEKSMETVEHVHCCDSTVVMTDSTVVMTDSTMVQPVDTLK
jgi:hypothetical protein